MPDEQAFQALAGDLGEAHQGAVLATTYSPTRATLHIDPSQIKAVLAYLRGRGFTFLASLHGVDYYPDEPRLGVLYELLDMKNVERVSVQARVPTDAPRLDSVVELFAGADFPEREVYDMFGVEFEGHPDLRRILMPEDYEGHPQRRDFPLGGEPILFTFNEQDNYGGAL